MWTGGSNSLGKNTTPTHTTPRASATSLQSVTRAPHTGCFFCIIKEYTSEALWAHFITRQSLRGFMKTSLKNSEPTCSLWHRTKSTQSFRNASRISASDWDLRVQMYYRGRTRGWCPMVTPARRNSGIPRQCILWEPIQGSQVDSQQTATTNAHSLLKSCILRESKTGDHLERIWHRRSHRFNWWESKGWRTGHPWLWWLSNWSTDARGLMIRLANRLLKPFNRKLVIFKTYAWNSHPSPVNRNVQRLDKLRNLERCSLDSKRLIKFWSRFWLHLIRTVQRQNRGTKNRGRGKMGWPKERHWRTRRDARRIPRLADSLQSVHKSPHSHGWGFIIKLCSPNTLWSQATVISAPPIWRISASGWSAKKSSKSKSDLKSGKVSDLHHLTKTGEFGTFQTDTKMRIALASVVLVVGVILGNSIISSFQEMQETRNDKLCQIDKSFCQWTPRSATGPRTLSNASTQVFQLTSKHWKWLNSTSVVGYGQRSRSRTVTPRTVNRGVFCMEIDAMQSITNQTREKKYFSWKKSSI